MSNTERRELIDLVREALQSRGFLSGLRARLRAEIYHSMEDRNEAPDKPPRLNVLINEMIREYLLFNRYHNTLSVFLSETGLDDAEPLAKDILEEAVNIIREPRDCLPLLYRFASSNRRDIEEALNTRRVHSSEETHAGTDAQSQYAASRPAF